MKAGGRKKMEGRKIRYTGGRRQTESKYWSCGCSSIISFASYYSCTPSRIENRRRGMKKSRRRR